MTKYELLRSLFDGRPVRIECGSWPDRVRQATVLGLERAGGSGECFSGAGRCFRVRVRCFGRPEAETVFVRTAD